MKNKLNKFIALLLALTLLLMFAAGCGKKQDEAEYTCFDDLQGQPISLWLACGYEPIVAEYFPESEQLLGNYVSDLSLLVRQGKAAACVIAEPFYYYFEDEMNDIIPLEEDLGTIDGGVIFSGEPLGQKLCSDFNVFLEEAKTDGFIDSLTDKWLRGDETQYNCDFSGLDESATHIRVGVATDEPPYAYKSKGAVIGYDIDIIIEFCERYGYYPEFGEGMYDTLITAIETDKYDVVCAGYEIVDERKESVLYSDPIYSNRILVLVKTNAAKVNFIESVTRSFGRTFIDDERYLDFLKGIEITLLISFAAVLIGTVVGFLLYFLYRDGGRRVKRFLDIAHIIMERVPMLVVLLVLYYIVFSKVPISAVIVAILAFGFYFSFEVFSAIMTSVQAVGKGQQEAAFATGFDKNESFFKIILPQARNIFMANYKGSIVSLLLETSVVGYISIVDLTRVGDVIRNNTYEAFFPLIAVAIFYFIISTVIISLVESWEKKTDPKNRSEEAIMKGIQKDSEEDEK